MSLVVTLSNLVRRRLLLLTLVVAVIMGGGAAGFHYIEGLNWLDSLYTSTQTLTTVGYGDVTPKSSAGRLFAIFLMIVGVGTVLYALSVLAQAAMRAEIVEAIGQRRKLKEMEKLEGHFIICGAGRVGIRVIRHFQRQGLPCVVIESDEEKIADLDLQGKGMNVIVGDATSEENLIAAGVKGARGLASCLADDAGNVYVALTARGLNPDLHIVARAVEAQAEASLIRAGANRVVAPTIIGGEAMARALLKPAISDFIDSIVAEGLDLVFEDIPVDGNSPYVDKQLRDTDLSGSGAIVIAIRRKGGEFAF